VSEKKKGPVSPFFHFIATHSEMALVSQKHINGKNTANIIAIRPKSHPGSFFGVFMFKTACIPLELQSLSTD
jgi:hypothetical protein